MDMCIPYQWYLPRHELPHAQLQSMELIYELDDKHGRWCTVSCYRRDSISIALICTLRSCKLYKLLPCRM